jgi:hypothetical protein
MWSITTALVIPNSKFFRKKTFPGIEEKRFVPG